MGPITKPTLTLFLLVGVILSAGSARAQKEEWTSIGPYMGEIHAIAIDPLRPEIIYAGTDQAGVFKSTDGGTSWVTATDGLRRYNAIEIHALAIDPKDPNIVLAGTGDGIFRSKNRGFTWSEVKRAPHGVNAFAIDPSSGNVIYAGGYSPYDKSNILRSTDRGATWTDVVRIEITRISTIAIDPTNPKIIYAGGDAAIVKSVDGGANWVSCISGLTLRQSPNSVVFQIAIDPSNPNTVYAATVRGIFKSVDGGANWTEINQGLPVNKFMTGANQGRPVPYATVIAVDQFNTGAIFAGVSQNGLYKSTNGGASWEPHGAGLAGSTILAIGLCPSNKNFVCVGTRRDGVFKSGDGGARWSPVNAGLHAAHINTIAVDPSNSNVIYAGGHTDQRILKTTNRGSSWTSVETQAVTGISINPSNTSTVYAATFTGIIASEDDGTNWTNISSSLPSRFAHAVAVDPSNPMTIFAGISDNTSGSPFNGVFKSTNGGVSWRFVGGELDGSSAEVLAIDPSDAKVIYAGGMLALRRPAQTTLFKSTDGGASWSTLLKGPERGRVTAIAIDPSNTNTVFVGTERGLLKTKNGGADWSMVNITPTVPSITSIAIDPVVKGLIYVGTSETVFMSTNGGDGWRWLSEGLPVIRVTALAIDPSDHDTVYAATAGASIFKRRFKDRREGKPAQNTGPKTAPSPPPSSPNKPPEPGSPTVDSPPIMLNRPRVNTTEDARRNKTHGIVSLRLLVDVDGSVKNVEVILGLPDGLSEEAVKAISKLKFKPAMKDGHPVVYPMTLEVTFDIR